MVTTIHVTMVTTGGRWTRFGGIKEDVQKSQRHSRDRYMTVHGKS